MSGNLGIGIGSANPTSSLVIGTTISQAGKSATSVVPNFTVDGATGNVTAQGKVVIGSANPNAALNSVTSLVTWGNVVHQNPYTVTANGAAGYWAYDMLPGGNWLVSNGNGSAWGAIGTNDNEPLMFATDKVWIGMFDSNGNNSCPSCVAFGGGTASATGTGNGGIPSPSHSLDIFPTNNGTATSDGAVRAYAFYHNSDVRLKSDIHPIDNALDKLMKIHGVEFTWKYDGHSDVGVIAQDVAKVFPEAVSSDKTGDHMMAVEYDSLAGPMIESIRQLKMENDIMKAELTEMHSEIKALKENNTQLHSINATSDDTHIKRPSVVEP
jgi:hypothetical protein